MLSHQISTSQTPAAKAAEFSCSDSVIVMGRETGMAADLSNIERLCAAISLPVIVGSGVTDKNVGSYVSKVCTMYM